MNQEEFEQLARKFIELDGKYRNANSDVAQYKQQKFPTIRDKYETIAEYAADEHLCRLFRIKLDDLKQIADDIRAARNKVENQLKKVIPNEVWFKIDDQAIGLAHTNWGGYHTYIVVETWSDNLPSLDHTYRGD